MEQKEHPFFVYCKKHKSKPSAKKAALWDAAVEQAKAYYGHQALNVVLRYTAPIHAGVDGDQLACEIYDAMKNYFS